MSERKTIIRTVGLKKHYTVGGNTVRALDGVDMSVLQGEFVCVAGRSGSGKSTMLNMLAGLEPPTEGEIIVRGKHHLEAIHPWCGIYKLPDSEGWKIRRRCCKNCRRNYPLCWFGIKTRKYVCFGF